MQSSSYNFTHAICRLPPRSLINGLRAIDIGNPSYDLFIKDHQSYVDALKNNGAQVKILKPVDEFPDSVFIEDAALCLPRGCIIMRPGAPSRLGEAAELIPILSDYYTNLATISGSGFIEGGDILTTETEILVGKSARTDSAGIEELRDIVKAWDYKVREVNTPEGILHFKTDCSLLDENTILSTKRLAESGCFEGYDVIHVVEGEEACANTIRFNQCVIMPKGFPKTRQLLESKGFIIQEIGNTEAAKLDGGMSCLSLRFTPS